MCLCHFPGSSSHVGGLDPPLELVSVLSPFPQSLLSQPLRLLLIVVPLSPHRGLPPQPGAGAAGAALCRPSLPVCRAWMEAAGRPHPDQSLDERSERSELWSPPRSRCPACPGRGSRLGAGSAFPWADFRAIPWSAGPAAGPTLSNNLQPLPSMFYPRALQELPKLRLGGAGGGPGLPKPHCEIPSRLLLMLFTRAEFGMARASPHPSSFVPFISAGRWISL